MKSLKYYGQVIAQVKESGVGYEKQNLTEKELGEIFLDIQQLTTLSKYRDVYGGIRLFSSIVGSTTTIEVREYGGEKMSLDQWCFYSDDAMLCFSAGLNLVISKSSQASLLIGRGGSIVLAFFENGARIILHIDIQNYMYS